MQGCLLLVAIPLAAFAVMALILVVKALYFVP